MPDLDGASGQTVLSVLPGKPHGGFSRVVSEHPLEGQGLRSAAWQSPVPMPLTLMQTQDTSSEEHLCWQYSACCTHHSRDNREGTAGTHLVPLDSAIPPHPPISALSV